MREKCARNRAARKLNARKRSCAKFEVERKLSELRYAAVKNLNYNFSALKDLTVSLIIYWNHLSKKKIQKLGIDGIPGHLIC